MIDVGGVVSPALLYPLKTKDLGAGSLDGTDDTSASLGFLKWAGWPVTSLYFLNLGVLGRREPISGV